MRDIILGLCSLGFFPGSSVKSVASNLETDFSVVIECLRPVFPYNWFGWLESLAGNLKAPVAQTFDGLRLTHRTQSFSAFIFNTRYAARCVFLCCRSPPAVHPLCTRRKSEGSFATQACVLI